MYVLCILVYYRSYATLIVEMQGKKQTRNVNNSNDMEQRFEGLNAKPRTGKAASK